MGLLSSIFGSNKSSSSTTANTTNVGFSDVSGPAIYGSNNQVTDLGAVREGVDIAREGLRIADNSVAEVSYLASDSIHEQSRLAETALGFAGDVVNSNVDLSRDAFDIISSTTGNALDIVAGSTRNALDFTGEIVQRQASDLASFVQNQNTTTDERLIQMAKWGAVALMATLTVNAYFTRKRAA